MGYVEQTLISPTPHLRSGARAFRSPEMNSCARWSANRRLAIAPEIFFPPTGSAMEASIGFPPSKYGSPLMCVIRIVNKNCGTVSRGLRPLARPRPIESPSRSGGAGLRGCGGPPAKGRPSVLRSVSSCPTRILFLANESQPDGHRFVRAVQQRFRRGSAGENAAAGDADHGQNATKEHPACRLRDSRGAMRGYGEPVNGEVGRTARSAGQTEHDFCNVSGSRILNSQVDGASVF